MLKFSKSSGLISKLELFENAGINDDYLAEIRKGDKFSVEAK